MRQSGNRSESTFHPLKEKHRHDWQSVLGYITSALCAQGCTHNDVTHSTGGGGGGDDSHRQPSSLHVQYLGSVTQVKKGCKPHSFYNTNTHTLPATTPNRVASTVPMWHNSGSPLDQCGGQTRGMLLRRPGPVGMLKVSGLAQTLGNGWKEMDKPQPQHTHTHTKTQTSIQQKLDTYSNQ
jgi:hypothetical protein